MPIQYGTTNITAVKSGSIIVNTVNYGSTTVFQNQVTMEVHNRDNYGTPYLSTSSTATTGSSTITVVPGTKVYFFIKLTNAVPAQYRSPYWTCISGTAWAAGSIFRLDAGAAFYHQDQFGDVSPRQMSSGGYSAPSSNLVEYVVNGRTLINDDRSGFWLRDEWSQYDELTLVIMNDSNSYDIVVGEYWYEYENTSGEWFEDGEYDGTNLDGLSNYTIFSSNYGVTYMCLTVWIQSEPSSDGAFNPVQLTYEI